MQNPEAIALPTDALVGLRALYNALRNADNLGELPFGQPGGDNLVNGVDWMVELATGYRAVLRINHHRPPQQGGKVDVTRVHRVQVMAIEATYG